MAQELKRLSELVARQREALLQDDADGLRRLAEQLHGRLGALQSAHRGPLAPPELDQLHTLRQGVNANQQLLHARQNHLRSTLAALTSAVPLQPAPTYQATGELAGTATPARAFARA
jgi:hypothetical protein